MSPRQSAPGAPPAGHRSVRVIPSDGVTMADGVRLAVRVWLPEDAEQQPVSAILDSVPYRISDGTAIGDASWGTYFAAHGHAFVRVDVRGSGDSEGVLADEYTEQEQHDCEQVIDWIAAQPWCTGAVGMIGVSWGAFAGLQMAARHPEALKGVVAIHGSDDRYSDDVHYVGGCVSPMDMPQWATSMAAYVNQPPDPLVVGERWRDLWLERLRHARLFIEPWMGHQRRDAYWRQGSACENYGAIRCPILAVGGWSDGYRDMVFRLLENVRGPVRGVIGPWGHTRPEAGAPGPAIGFLQECLRFFAASLDGADNGFFDEPGLISYMQDAVGPAGSYAVRPGRWVADPSWPSPFVAPWTRSLDERALVDDSHSTATRSLNGLQATGVDGGVWCGDGSPADFALDQRPDDGASLCWDSEPLDERLELLGPGEATLTISVDEPQALVCVRVCDVAPDGRSTLVARGLLNLSRREGHDRSVPMPVGEPVTVRVPLQSTAYAIPEGHRVRLALSDTYWPSAWPSPRPTTLTVHCGPHSVLTLPHRSPSPLDDRLRAFDPPETGTPLQCETTMLRPGGRTVSRDLSSGETAVTFDWHPSRVKILATQTEIGEENVSTYRVREGEPLSATVVCRVSVTIDREGWHTRTEVASTMTCNEEAFTVTTQLDAYENDIRVHALARTHRFPRDGV